MILDSYGSVCRALLMTGALSLFARNEHGHKVRKMDIRPRKPSRQPFEEQTKDLEMQMSEATLQNGCELQPRTLLPSLRPSDPLTRSLPVKRPFNSDRLSQKTIDDNAPLSGLIG